MPKIIQRNKVKPKNYIGINFGFLEIVEMVGRDKHGNQILKVKCKCGNIEERNIVSLQKTKRDNCTQMCLECRDSKHGEAHRETKTKLYVHWCNMKKRCYSESYQFKHLYKGKGVIVCSEWHKFSSFRDWAMANGYEENLTIDRINNDGNYEPLNCRWVTIKEQSRNKCTNIYIEHDGVKYVFADFCEKFNLEYRKAYSKFKKGFTSSMLILQH